ncbi:MAG TPA: prepilin-type N-terminal cleavage/methylation domain-containing protein [Candidatus Omnitrophota bacterium]|nr:prepilin-type N-terminal cleavage/methylation domain-containing protein [Candidatus Omnitrophota bacterium]HPD85312.1 prepilin-type N-terminal cleavage/methylation domain-containing protein [Candidatus Omnitrophota bacterium]HRZ04187.1 prepilin-type N-terminal cleavage/methylation domain-containing protein [Candidatus Omnitrophota bacterium]
MKRKGNAGFTLLEIIVVIIIISVLASLALPRFFKTVEYSRSAEALANLSTIRQSVERCYLAKGNSALNCGAFASIDVADPGLTPNALFGYGINAAADDWTITATRNGTQGGDGASQITINRAGTRQGTGVFGGI